MNVIYYNIKDDSTVTKFKETIKSKIDKIYWMETLVLIESEKLHFKNIVQLLYSFFKEHKLDIEDFVYVFNFSGFDEQNWFCQILKKKGLKKVSSNFK